MSMASLNEVPVAYGISAQRAALSAVLGSRTFLKNPRLAALLKYLCERCFEGQADSIKEFNIATDVFGRPAEFDQSQDAIVRVEMHRLRKKLAEFYRTEGEQEPVEIVIHSGRYLPEFVAKRTLELPAKEPEPDVPELAPLPRKNLILTLGAPRHRLWVIGLLFAAAGAATVFAVRFEARGDRKDTVFHAAASTQAALPTGAVPIGGGLHILCGSSGPEWRDREGNVWGADAFFSGGTAVQVTDQPVYRTRDSALFRNARTGPFSYKIPLKPGVYELHLYFADESYRPGVALEGGENTRVFTVSLNGATLLRDFDIIADAGPNTADVRVFKDIHPASDGYLHLAFSGNQGAPLINAIEVLPGIAHHLRRIRIVTQDSTVVDRAGVTWYPDNYFKNGRELARPFVVSGPEDIQIYGGERYGNFSYAIPVADGRYRATLRFAESYWGATGGGGAGTRVFDVYCNGIALLRNFDMLKEAAPRTQIVRTFDNLEPNAQGKLLFTFVPVKNYANLSAIEVVDE